MNPLVELQENFLQDGVDLQIDAREWAQIRELLPAEGQPDVDDMRVLIEMRTMARTVCPQFDAYFFPAFKKYLLADGRLSAMEQFELMRLIFGGGGVDENEKAFLRDLRKSLPQPSAEFDEMFRLV